MSWLDVSTQAILDDDYPLLLQSIYGLMRETREDPFLLEDILMAADYLSGSPDHVLRALEAMRFVADRTPCGEERWRRVKNSMIQTSVLSGEPELVMETYQYIRDREPKSDTGQWDMYVDDLMLPFDVSDMADNLELFRLVMMDCCMSPQEEFCRAFSKMYRGTMAASASARAARVTAATPAQAQPQGGARVPSQMERACAALADVRAACVGGGNGDGGAGFGHRESLAAMTMLSNDLVPSRPTFRRPLEALSYAA